MDHTMQAYLKRCSTEQLMGFLEDCMRRNMWSEYAPAIPAVLAALQSRNVLLPEQLRASWDTYIRSEGEEESPLYL